MDMRNGLTRVKGWRRQRLDEGLQLRPAAGLDLSGTRGQAGEELGHLLLHQSFRAPAGVARDLLAGPPPDRLIGVEVRAVGRESNQAQIESRSRQVGPERLAPMRGAVIPDHNQRPGVLGPPLPQKRSARLGGAVAREFHILHFPGLQADRRVVASFLSPAGARRVHQSRLAFEHPLAPQVRVGAEVRFIDKEDLRPGRPGLAHQSGILLQEGPPARRIGFQQPLLRPLEDEAQPVQIAQTGAAAQPSAAALLYEPPDYLPVPIRQVHPDLRRGHLDGYLQPGLRLGIQGGGGPPVCSNASAVGPSRPNASSQWPIVWASRSSSSATLAAVQPWANNQTACHRSRSRGVGARYIRSRTWRRSRPQRASHSLLPVILSPPARSVTPGTPYDRNHVGF